MTESSGNMANIFLLTYSLSCALTECTIASRRSLARHKQPLLYTTNPPNSRQN